MATSVVTNTLLARLSGAGRQQLLARAVPVELVLGAILSEASQPTRYAYFPGPGFLSVMTAGRDLPILEVGLVGREGIVGAHLALGVTVTPLRILVQGRGFAMRVAAADFQRALARDPILHALVDRYLYVQLAQAATAAACAGRHTLRMRLARWLLMSQDRSGSDHFPLTQQFASYMLGVRRVGVTLAAADLQRRNLIHYRRGEVTILDRTGLRAAACRCYAHDRQVYRQVMG
jgi:hypothetical protein